MKMAIPTKDAVIHKTSLTELTLNKHIEFLANYETHKATKYDYAVSESLRVSGIYWAITALDIMNAANRTDKQKVGIYKYQSEKVRKPQNSYNPFPGYINT